MASQKSDAVGDAAPDKSEGRLREPAEIRHRAELLALAATDEDQRPESWTLSPRAILTYVLGGITIKAEIDGETRSVPITTKFYGDRSIVERAIVTLASERALLLLGDPGTGKSWFSEHLAAAVSGDSTLTIQGTAGTTEEHIKYSWNIARVIAEGPTPQNLTPSPTMLAMTRGGLLRFEEITRCVPDVQDALVSILSDKAIAVPELPEANMVWARPGFNVIATANTRDQGVNELSAALKRRFNYIHIPIVQDAKTEVAIVRQRSAELLERYRLPLEVPPQVAELITTVFREIREGKSGDGVSLKQPSTTLSTAEAIGVAVESTLRASFFGKSKVGGGDIARNIVGSIVKEDLGDLSALKEYATLVAKKRASKKGEWDTFYDGLQEVLPGK
jgi:MoxR-like ATPase